MLSLWGGDCLGESQSLNINHNQLNERRREGKGNLFDSWREHRCTPHKPPFEFLYADPPSRPFPLPLKILSPAASLFSVLNLFVATCPLHRAKEKKATEPDFSACTCEVISSGLSPQSWPPSHRIDFFCVYGLASHRQEYFQNRNPTSTPCPHQASKLLYLSKLPRSRTIEL